MARILIHVGLPKTGTTSLQYLLRKSSPEQLGPVAYSRFVDSEIVQSRCFANAVGLGRDSGRKDTPALYVGRVHEQIKAGAQYCIISDETLSQVDRIDRRLMQEMLSRLSDIGEVEIVLTIRPWFEWLESLINQSVKTANIDSSLANVTSVKSINGYTISFLKVFSFYRYNAQYYESKTMWPVRIVSPGTDVVAGFSDLLGVPLPKLREDGGHKNQSPSISGSFARYAKALGIADMKVPDVPTFLSRRDADKLHNANRVWLQRFQKIVGNTITVDDYESFRQRTAAHGALDHLFKHVPSII